MSSVTQIADKIFLVDNFIDRQTCSSLVSSCRTSRSILPRPDRNPFEIVTDFSQIYDMQYVLQMIHAAVKSLYSSVVIEDSIDARNSLLKIQKPGENHSEHTDSNRNNSDDKSYGRSALDEDIKRTSEISTIVVLNDDYRGGEFFFRDHGVRLKLPAGALLAWPSEGNFHGVDVVTGNSPRYSLVSWWYEPLELKK